MLFTCITIVSCDARNNHSCVVLCVAKKMFSNVTRNAWDTIAFLIINNLKMLSIDSKINHTDLFCKYT